MESPISDDVEFEADDELLRKWVVGAFDAARERLGELPGGEQTLSDALADDRRWLEEAELMLPLVHRLDRETPSLREAGGR